MMKQKNILKSETGYMMVGSVIMLTILAIAGISTIEVSSADSGTMTTSFSKARAFYAAHSGLEWAKYQLDHGYDPTTTGKPSVDGNFNVTWDPLNKVLNSTGSSDIALAQQSINAQCSANCINFLNDPTFDFQATQGTLKDIKFKKTCNSEFHIKEMDISWTNANAQQKVSQIKIDYYHFMAGEVGIVYDQRTGFSVGLPSGGAVAYPAAQTIDITDVDIVDDGEHTINEILLTYTSSDYKPQPTDKFTITTRFADGCAYSQDFSQPEVDDPIGNIDDPQQDNPIGGIDDPQQDDFVDITIDEDDSLNDNPPTDRDIDVVLDNPDIGDGPLPNIPEEDETIPTDEGEGPSWGTIDRLPRDGEQTFNCDDCEVFDPCAIADDVGTMGGDGCASDGDPADTPGESPGDGDNNGPDF